MNIDVCDNCRQEIDLKKSLRMRINSAGEQRTFAFCSGDCGAAVLEKFARSMAAKLKLPRETAKAKERA